MNPIKKKYYLCDFGVSQEIDANLKKMDIRFTPIYYPDKVLQTYGEIEVKNAYNYDLYALGISVI